MVNKITQGFNNLKGWIGRNPTKAIALSLFLLFSGYEGGTFGADKSHRNFDNKIYESIDLNDENNATLERLISDNHLSISPRLCKAVMDGENRFKNKNRVNAISDWLEAHGTERCDGATWGSLGWLLSINGKEGSYGPFQVQRKALDKYKTFDNAQYDPLINKIIYFKFNGETLLSLLTKKGGVYEGKTEKDIIDMIQNEKLSMNDAGGRVGVAFGMVLLNKIYERVAEEHLGHFRVFDSRDREYFEAITVALRATDPEKVLKNGYTLFLLQLHDLTNFLQGTNDNISIVTSTGTYGDTTQARVERYFKSTDLGETGLLSNSNVAADYMFNQRNQIFEKFLQCLATKGIVDDNNNISPKITHDGYQYLVSKEGRSFLYYWTNLTFNHKYAVYNCLMNSNIFLEDKNLLNAKRNDYMFQQNKEGYQSFIQDLLEKYYNLRYKNGKFVQEYYKLLRDVFATCYSKTESLQLFKTVIPEIQEPATLTSNEKNLPGRMFTYILESSGGAYNKMNQNNTETISSSQTNNNNISETSLVDNTETNTEKNTDKPTDEPTEVNQQNHYYQLPANTIISNNKAKDRAVKIESNGNGFRLTYGNQLEILWTLATQDPEFMTKLTKKFSTNEQGLRAAMNNNQEKVRAMFVDKKGNSFTYGKNGTRHWHQKGKDDTIFLIKID